MAQVEANEGNGEQGEDAAKGGLTGLQFALAIVLVAALLVVAWFLIDRNLIDQKSGPAFYADVVQGLVILGAAFFGIPVTWRAGKASGKSEGEKDKQDALKEQRRGIGERGRTLTQAAMDRQQGLHRVIEEQFASDAGDRRYRLARDDLGTRTIEIDMDDVGGTAQALTKLDQFMVDLQEVP
jgi:hypothetical protein